MHDLQPALNRPIGRALRHPSDPSEAYDSLGRCLSCLRESAAPCAVVVQNGKLLGVVEERDIVEALLQGTSIHAPIGAFVRDASVTLRSSDTGSTALRQLDERGSAYAVVVDEDDRPLGILTWSDVVAVPDEPLRPRMVGGMATPFGVYLTDGLTRGGVGPWALVVTGALLFGIFLVANMAAYGLELVTRPWNLSESLRGSLLGAASLLVFLGGIRALPLAGTHAAEHMVVHAIERNEPLVPEVVARMPRVHPRCGTNFAAGAMLFMGVFSSSWHPDPQLRLLVAALVTLVFWRPLGSMLQYFVTTKPPTRAQIEAGIRSGKDLLVKYQTAPRIHGSVWIRLWNSGLPQIMAGSTLASLIAEGVARLTGFEPLVRVYF